MNGVILGVKMMQHMPIRAATMDTMMDVVNEPVLERVAAVMAGPIRELATVEMTAQP